MASDTKDIKIKRVGLRVTDKKEAAEFLKNQDNIGRSLSYMVDVWSTIFGTDDVMLNLTDIIETSIEIRKFLNSDIDINNVNPGVVLEEKPKSSKASAPAIKLDKSEESSEVNSDDVLSQNGLLFE